MSPAVTRASRARLATVSAPAPDLYVARGGAYDKAGKSIQPAARLTKFESWFVTQPQEPRSTWWYTDGKSIGFRVVCEE